MDSLSFTQVRDVRKLLALLALSVFGSLTLITYLALFGKSCQRPKHSLINHETTAFENSQIINDAENEFEKFSLAFPSLAELYGYGTKDLQLEKLRTEFPYLQNNLYLDYAGAGLHRTSQLLGLFHNLSTHLYGNAHSPSPCSKNTEDKIALVRDQILDFFKAPKDEYSVIFTSGATSALRLIGESFPFKPTKSKYVFLRNNHNSVVGIREFALSQSCNFTALSKGNVVNYFDSISNTKETIESKETTYNLFAYPAEDNFNGVKFPLEWINLVHSANKPNNQWLVLLDSAAFVSNSPLNLQIHKPDFVTISFYKMFGFQTGIGALIARKSALDVLTPLYWGGGQVITALPDEKYQPLLSSSYEKFEAGTLNFYGIMSVEEGLNALNTIGMESIMKHTHSLAQYLSDKLFNMKHSNGLKAIRLYGRHKNGISSQGPIVTFNILKNDGTYYLLDEIHQIFDQSHVHIRTGCNCNPGSCHEDLELTNEEVKTAVNESTVVCVSSGVKGTIRKPFGALRASIGYPTSFVDVVEFALFVEVNFVK